MAAANFGWSLEVIWVPDGVKIYLLYMAVLLLL